jgi:Meckel syndrome type 1 protein
MPTGPSVPAAATALPLRPPIPAANGTEGAPGTPAGLGADAAVEQPLPTTTAVSTAAARATRLVDVLQSATARPAGTGAASATPTSNAAATPPAATVAGAARSFGQASDQGATGGSASQPATPVPVQPAAAAPAQGGMPVAATAPTPGVGLEHAVETVRLALRAAADRGVTHARINLTPRELGSIEVHLRQTADGLVARVVAEHATAAQLLQNAGGELRRQLEAQGLTLLRLDIGASGEQGGRPGDRALANGGGAFGDAGSSRNRDGDADPLALLDGTTDPASTTTTLALPNGALVDVLA